LAHFGSQEGGEIGLISFQERGEERGRKKGNCFRPPSWRANPQEVVYDIKTTTSGGKRRGSIRKRN